MVGQIYGTGTGISETIPPPPDAPLTGEEASFFDEVERFKAKVDEAQALYRQLERKRAAAATNPTIKREYDKVMSDADEMGAKVSDVERAVASVRTGIAETITGWFGLEGIREAKNHLQGLGIAQLAVLAVSAAVAWIATWISEAYVVDRKLTAIEGMINDGVDPRTAGDIIEKNPPTAAGEFFGKFGLGLGIAGAAAIALYYMFEKKRGF